MRVNKRSAGILLFRRVPHFEFFLIHPGGPYFYNRRHGAWSIPKGEFMEDETPFEAAVREFQEETGFPIDGEFHALTPIIQKSGKQVHAWAVEGTLDATKVVSNTFRLEWPSGSGKFEVFPEVDEAGWFPMGAARERIIPAQAAFLDEVMSLFGRPV